MKRFSKLILMILVIYIVAWFLSNVLTITLFMNEGEKAYQIEINRIHTSIHSEETAEEIDISGNEYIRDIRFLPADSDPRGTQDFFDGSLTPGGSVYLVKPAYTNEKLIGYVRYVYEPMNLNGYRTILITMNLILVATFVFAMVLLLYVRSCILKPFHEMQEYPIELSKGRLKKGLKENKNRFFGRFIWGLDMLRESMESQKRKEIALEKERKTLILSISHGIKTPLSSIMLYSKALSENLYSSEEKRKAAADSIEDNARQIERLVSEIVSSQTQNLVDMEVVREDFYLADLMNSVRDVFGEKLSVLQTKFQIDDYPNLILQGDKQRMIDVFENLIENAIKYGDGVSICISFEKEDNCLLISVANTGLSLPPSEADHVFDSFFRGSNATDKPGNGLGLYICKYLMTKMKGDIYIAKSEKGMRFVLVVPIA